MAIGGAWLLPMFIGIRELFVNQGRTFRRCLPPAEYAMSVVCDKQNFREAPRHEPVRVRWLTMIYDLLQDLRIRHLNHCSQLSGTREIHYPSATT